MQIMVIYDSMFGNTAQIARAIEAGLAEHGPVALRSLSEVGSLPPGLGLLLIGGPTQGHGVGPALKAFLDTLPAERVEGVSVATFDTRLKWPEFLSGSAARGIAKRLEQKGGRLVVEPASFIVEGKEGPLAEGELARATDWARHLSASLTAVA